MFKRAVKRQKRVELEDKLGLREDLRGAVSDSDESSDSESESENEQISNSASDDEQENSEPSDEEGEEIDEDNEDGVEDDLDESDEELEELSINDALINPLFGEYPRKRCAICPGRLLTFEKFGSQHLESKAHTRRLNRFFTFVDEQKLNKDDDVHSTIDAFNQQLGTTPKEKSKKEENRIKRARIARQKRLERKLEAKKTLPVPLDEVEKKHVENNSGDAPDAAKEAKRAERRIRKKANKAKFAEERRQTEKSKKDTTDKEEKQNKKRKA
ncbi:hypothetical protein WALSEDRAFT_70729 [Wallemia mellicola CBS 633.66]|uniref:Uncharacterized protein n=1 Tax=Wallemia mellicola (strain ATCC MYA-4683 / CBS 633.66) TaxID=671144 RepID=I4Y5P3_WALMC|nr:hypothetical protein WALSEDRAFT_70729 [Wallemia mellicola CBS 633.66]EIM19285.1 hypothetical protein WALSEDRAFT_70729 [Wallemia mellicola CBS 633.66]|eukprot:XP_006960678.1 hypothetical protein WALSEDRAFT_70729 [Wallemia mellicola CBS 633.66]